MAGVTTGLVALGVVGLFVAGYLFLSAPIVKWRGPDAFRALEKEFVDTARVERDEKSREQYENYRYWIMNGEPAYRRAYGQARFVGIVFSLLVASSCFVLAVLAARKRGSGGRVGGGP